MDASFCMSPWLCHRKWDSERIQRAIEKVQSMENVAGSLFSDEIISDEDFKNFTSLDHDPGHLNPKLKARYLLHVAFTNIEKRYRC